MSISRKILSLTNPFQTILIVLLVSSSFTFSFGSNQKIDSLLNVLPTLPDDTSRVNLLNKLSWEFHRSNIDKTFHYGKAALRLGKELKYPAGIARALNLLAIGYSSKGKIEKAIEYNKICLRIADSIHNDYLISCATNDLGISYSEQGKYNEALLLLQRSLEIAEAQNDILGHCFSLSNIGNIHLTMGNIEDAESYYNKSIEVGKKSSDPMVLTSAYTSSGSFFAEQKKYDKAIENYQLSFDIAKKADDKSTMAINKLNIGFVHLDKGLNEIAIQFALEAIKIATDAGESNMLAYFYHDLAYMYSSIGKYRKSLESNLSSLDLAKEFGITELEISVYSEMSEVFVQTQNYKDAFEYHRLYSNLQDSIFSKENVQHLAELEEKYQTEKKEKENTLLKALQKEKDATIKEQQSLAFALSVITFLLGALGFMIFWAYRSKNNSHKLLEQKVEERTKELQSLNTSLKRSNEELERFAFIASHDLKEPLRNIGSFVKLLEYELNIKPDTKAYEYISFVVKNTKQMHSLIEDVLEYSKFAHQKEPPQKVDLNKVLDDIKSSISNTLQERSVRIKVKNNLPFIFGHSSKMFFLFKNLIENGIKYNDGEYPEIKIRHQKDNQFHIFSIADNGIGIEKEYFDTIFQMFKRLHDRQSYEGTGLGLSLCKKIVTEAGGTIWLDSQIGKGSTFYFTIPRDYSVEVKDLKVEKGEVIDFTTVRSSKSSRNMV